jgi:hypothetical protein
MFELSVTSLLRNSQPTVVGQNANQFANLHSKLRLMFLPTARLEKRISLTISLLALDPSSLLNPPW